MTRSCAPDPSESRFEALYAAYYGRVLGYVLRRAPAGVASDVVADVFLVAWGRQERVPEEPLPWLLGVARKTLANERRGGRRRAALVDALEETSRAGEAEITGNEQLSGLSHSVARLAEADRELLRLIAWDDLTTREAAVVLGISHVACRVRLHRVRRRLARELGGPSGLRSTIGGAGRLDTGREAR
jgi:RNA polymerase sigma-70 factor (ECF subfamily)